MEALFDGNIVFVFFFAMIAIYNYSDLRIYESRNIEIADRRYFPWR